MSGGICFLFMLGVDFILKKDLEQQFPRDFCLVREHISFNEK